MFFRGLTVEKRTNEMILKRGVIVNTIGVVARFSKAFYVILFSATLGAEKFGIYTYSFALFDLICTILQFGYGQALAVQFGKYRDNKQNKYIFNTGNKVFLLAFLISSAVAAILLFSIPWIFDFFGFEHDYIPALQVFCFGIPAFALKYNILFSLRASFDTRPEVLIISIVEPLLIFVGGLIVFYFKKDVYLACVALVVSYYISCALSYWLFVKKYGRGPREKDPHFKFTKFAKKSSTIGLMETMNMMMGRCDLLFVGYFVSTAMMGIYGAAYEITSMIMKVRAAVEPTLGSLVQKIHHEANKVKTEKWLTSSMFWTLLPTTIIVGAIILSPSFFMSFFKFESTYQSYFMVLSMLAIGRMLHTVFGLIDVPLYMVDHSHSSMKISILNFVCNLVFFSILIPKIGIFGAGIGFVLAAVITCLYRLYLSKKIFDMVPINWTFLIPFTCFGLALAATKPLQMRMDTDFFRNVGLILGYIGIYLLCFHILRKKFLKKITKTPALEMED